VILAIDAGNSRIKWGAYRDGSWISTGAVANDQLPALTSALSAIPKPDKIAISNVAGERMRVGLAETLARLSMDMHWVKPERERCGVKNNYADPAKLGSDRWAALIAARGLQRGPVVVVNAGTALTVDALTESGEFLGGLIVPGIKLMLHSLTTGTAHAHARHGEFVAFPTNTLDAIYSGAMNAALGSIERVVAALSAREGASVNCIVSGGAASTLMPHLAVNAVEVPNLVLQGLVALVESAP
jgi:type III pantothenate kinase